MLIELVALKQNDSDLDELIRIHFEPSVSRYISISDNYFDYVTETDHVWYYKIIADGILAGGIQCEMHDNTMYLCVCVDEKHRRLGIAEQSLIQLFSIIPMTVKTIEVSIDETNIPSIHLFQKLGFQLAERDNDLITYRRSLH
jgi:ribosomal protein S18 acetylase RimI-like enzyme